MRIAIVGSGISGITAAHILQRAHEVTLFERNDYLGGHTHTVEVNDPTNGPTPVDTGFIVFNDRTYPLFIKLLGQLGVSAQNSDMSFGLWCEETGLQYAGSNLNTLFGQRGNLLRPRFWGMLRDILRFNRSAVRDLDAGTVGDVSLGEYLRAGRYGREMVRDYIIPMGAAIWSTPPGKMLEFPALTFVRFFRNHGLLSVSDRPQWKTVAGGSSQYVRAFAKGFHGTVFTRAPVRSVRREDGGVVLALEGGEEARFDGVVLAAHADEALALLSDASDEERRILGPWSYQTNRTVLHTDRAVMPPIRRVWSSWNYTREAGGGGDATMSLTYHMNRLQNLASRRDYFVSLNRRHPVDPGTVIQEMDYTHPVFSSAAITAQADLSQLNGIRNTWFCGAYWGYGFHEDGVRSGVGVARDMGLEF